MNEVNAALAESQQADLASKLVAMDTSKAEEKHQNLKTHIVIIFLFPKVGR